MGDCVGGTVDADQEAPASAYCGYRAATDIATSDTKQITDYPAQAKTNPRPRFRARSTGFLHSESSAVPAKVPLAHTDSRHGLGQAHDSAMGAPGRVADTAYAQLSRTTTHQTLVLARIPRCQAAAHSRSDTTLDIDAILAEQSFLGQVVSIALDHADPASDVTFALAIVPQ